MVNASLLELARYVVLNPVRAHMCAAPSEWPWSSYHATIGTAPKPDWLNTAWLLAQFGLSTESAITQRICNHPRQPIRDGSGIPHRLLQPERECRNL